MFSKLFKLNFFLSKYGVFCLHGVVCFGCVQWVEQDIDFDVVGKIVMADVMFPNPLYFHFRESKKLFALANIKPGYPFKKHLNHCVATESGTAVCMCTCDLFQ